VFVFTFENELLLYANIDQKLVNSLHGLLNLRNRRIRLSCYYNRV